MYMVKEELKSRIQGYLRELCLSDIKKFYCEVAKAAEKESLSYEEYLLELIERQCIIRRSKRIERHLRESKLPLEKTFETFEMNRLPRKLIQQVKTLMKGAFIDHKENILAFGNPGSGKTHLLCALGQKLIRDGRRILFTTCSLLVQTLLLAKQELKLPRMLKKIEKYDAIIIDDIGYVQQNREEMEILFTLLADRYERGSIMLTSNLPFSQWEKIFKNPMVTAAAIDRLVHHSIILELNLSSYRMDAAKKRRVRR